jgi:hypothetical protein
VLIFNLNFMENTLPNQNIIDGAGHVFTTEEIAYIEQQGFTIEQVREAAGKVPEGAAKLTLEALLGEAAQDKDPNEPNVMDPASPNNEQPGESTPPETTT